MFRAHFQMKSYTPLALFHPAGTFPRPGKNPCLPRMKFSASVARVFLLFPSVLTAQVPVRNRVSDAAINAAIGGVAGAMWSMIRRTSVSKGAGQGLAGGLIVSGGRQTAARTFFGAGLIGREVSAVGVSLVASVGKPSTTFAFPWGPVSVQYSKGLIDWRVNVADCIITAATALSPHTSLDFGYSLSAGVPVFRTHGSGVTGLQGTDASGVTQGAVIWLEPSAFTSERRARRVIGHESVHVTQEDFVQKALALPAESALIGRSSWGKTFLKHFDLGVLGYASALAVAHQIPYRSQPWEREAYGLQSH
jgi:hypothetical protein